MILVENCSPQRFYAVTERDPAARDLKSAEMFSGGGRIHTERNEIGFDRVEEIGETAEDPTRCQRLERRDCPAFAFSVVGDR
jgi:hypothetical protein